MKAFNEYQKSIIQDRRFLESKNEIFESLNGFLLNLKSRCDKDFFPEKSIFKKGHYKIVRGENLASMPYVALDYPRFVSKSDFLIIRRLFWWGYGWFSFIHYSKGFYEQLQSPINNLKEENNWKLCFPQNQFHYPDYLKLRQKPDLEKYVIPFLSYSLENTIEFIEIQYLKEYEHLKAHLELLKVP